MAPEYDKLVDLVKEKKRDDVVIARLEGSINEDISMIYEIFSFPRIVMFFPGSVDIRSNFRGQRVVQALFGWVEQNAQKIEKQKLKMLESDEAQPKSAVKAALDDKIEKNLKSLNKTKAYDLEEAVGFGKNATGEIEFLKIEMLNMKNRIINLEKDIEELKNNTLSLVYDKVKNDKVILDAGENLDLNSSRSTQEDLAMKLKLVKEKKRMAEGFFDKISTFDIFVYFGIVLFLIALVITIKKILFKKSKNNVANDHAKV